MQMERYYFDLQDIKNVYGHNEKMSQTKDEQIQIKCSYYFVQHPN